jgi:hypothetical protein
MNNAVLISASCTTGWLDWVHGEPWLCPEGLLRRSLGFRATVRHLLGPTVDEDNPARRSFTTAEIGAIIAANPRNRWIPWNDVRFARIKKSPMDTSLYLDLADGRREKFLWLAADGGEDRLSDAFTQSLPGKWAGPRDRGE